MNNFYLNNYDKKIFMESNNGVLLLFPKYQYSIFLPEFSACSLEYVDKSIKYFESKEMKTSIYEYNGKKLLHIDDIYYNNISIIIIKILEKILRTGVITESCLTDYNTINDINLSKKQLNILCNNLGGLNPDRIMNIQLLD
jgi:hypothetical protein